VDYDVSETGNYSGFYLKWGEDEFDPDDWDAINFRIRGDQEAGFTGKVKVELKIREEGWGWKIFYLEDITSEWQHIVIPLDEFDSPPWGSQEWNKTNEFVITFEHNRATEKKGRIYLDDVAFEVGYAGGSH